MTNTADKHVEINTKYDIHERIYGFILRVIKLVNVLPKISSNSVIAPQLLRCVTSMGANDQEADGTLTKKDFIHCYTLVRKESKEANFWLRLISDTNPNLRTDIKSLLQEGKELTAIISSIINNTRI
jgi:four helix bundle protein